MLLLEMTSAKYRIPIDLRRFRLIDTEIYLDLVLGMICGEKDHVSFNTFYYSDRRSFGPVLLGEKFTKLLASHYCRLENG